MNEFEETEEKITDDVSETADIEDLPDDPAREAADYARSFGFDKAADYIERHYDGDDFDPCMPIPISTRNMDLEGKEAENGVPFERRTAQLTDGLEVEGVFPVFDSFHHVELGEDAKDLSLYQQFDACKKDFQDNLYEDVDLSAFTIGDMERMEDSLGFAPEGYTWQHNPETGSFDLVSSDDHSVGHTGGNALWGK